MGLLDGTPNPEPVNPVLSEIQNLSPQAHQALLQAHQAMSGGPAVHASEATLGTPSAATPAPTPMLAPHMQSQVPQIGSSPAPHVEAPRGTIPGEENNVARMTNEGSGISQIHSPVVRGIATGVDTVGKILAPGIEKKVPGTEGHNQQLIAQGNNEVKTLLGQNETQAQTGLIGANTGRVNEETAEAPQRAEDTHDLTRSTIDKNEQDKAVTLQQAHANAVQKALSEGRDPSQDPTVQHLANAIIGLQPGQNKEEAAPKTIQIEGPDGKPHQMAFNPKNGKYDQDQGVTGEKPPVVNVHAGDAREFQEKEKGRGLLDKAEAAYRTAQQGANTMRDMVASASAGNKMSAQVLPLEGALAITTAQGVHRINRTEVDQYAGAGSLYDKIAGEVGKLTQGQPIPKNILGDIQKLTDIQEKGAYQTYKGAHDSAVKRYSLQGEDPLPEPGAGGGPAPKEGDIKTNSHGDKVKYHNGAWGPA